MSRAPIIDQLLQLHNEKLVSFHMPGHKNGSIYDQFPYKNFKSMLAYMDTTEIPGADNLHNPQEAILESQERAKRVFGSDETFFLINGSTGGIYSMIMAVTYPGDKIIIGRNSHQSVINSTILGDLIPIYLHPEIEVEQGIALGISPKEVEKKIQEHPDVKAIVITYPTYHGIASDLKKIAEVVHKYDKILLVDEAHGAHLGLSTQLPMTALACGADIVVQSTHKTLPSFTQSAMLHVQGTRVDRQRLKTMLRINQSSSPSYILLASLDLAVMIYESQGKYLMEKLLENIAEFREAIQKLDYVSILGEGRLGTQSIQALDPTKLWFSLHQRNIPGYELENQLRKQFHIQMELSNQYGVLGIASIANHKRDFGCLLNAMECLEKASGKKKTYSPPIVGFNTPEQVLTPRQALYGEKKRVPIQDAIGRVSGEYIIPYPPGIPILVPGEVITKEITAYVKEVIYQGMEVLGIQDSTFQTLDILV